MTVHPLTTLDPEAPLEDLSPLADIVGDAVIVGLGESAHLQHEFNVLRHRVLRFLVERMGFRAFLLESGWCEGLALDHWLQTGSGSLPDLQRTAVSYGLGACEEVGAQLRWMRAVNEAGGRLHYAGTDMVAVLATPDPALQPALAYLSMVDPSAADWFRSRIEPLAALVRSEQQDIPRYRAVAAAQRDELGALIAHLGHLYDDREPDYAAATSPAEFRVARRHVELLRQWESLLRHFPYGGPDLPPSDPFSDGRARDRFMAENTRWLVEHLGAGERVVVMAHNGHLQRQPTAASPGPDGERQVAIATTFGQYLAEWVGPSYRPIALTHTTGSLDMGGPIDLGDPRPGSLDALLGGLSDGPFLADLRTWPDSSLEKVDAMRLNEMYVEIELPRAFDAVLHLPRTRPCDMLPADDGAA